MPAPETTDTEESTESGESAAENILDISDADFLNLPFEEPSDQDEDTSEEKEETEEEDESSESEDDSEGTDEEEVEDTDTETESDAENEESEELEDTEGDESEDEVKETEEDQIDYKVEYNKLLAPFKANGTQMQVKNVDDAVTLMKMGANYHKKMAGLKPSLKIVKLLEKNSLLDLDKINYLIDLHAKKPEAVTKLVKDSGVNPLDIDVTEESDYTPEARSVSDTELDLDNVLESIKTTPTYSKTLNVITEQWDDKSRDTIASSPHIISVINEHVADGTYDAITEVVNRERSLGRLQGTSDLEAYKTIGDIMHNNYQLPGQTLPASTTKPAAKKTTSSEKERKKRKKSVSGTKVIKSTAKADFNPLSMSDEEFAKVSDTRF